MAAKQEDQVKNGSNANGNQTGEQAFQNGNNPDNSRGKSEDRVGVPVKSSFDERTGVSQPFVRTDGSQDNGAPDLSKPEGARRETTREGDKTTVEETEVAIKEGTITGNQKLGSEEANEKPKNPVAEKHDTGADDNVGTQVTGKNTKSAKK